MNEPDNENPRYAQAKRVSHALQTLAHGIEDFLRDVAGEPLAFVVVVSVDGTAQYVSNAQRADGVELLRSLLARWEQGRADVPAHMNPAFIAGAAPRTGGEG